MVLTPVVLCVPIPSLNTKKGFLDVIKVKQMIRAKDVRVFGNYQANDALPLQFHTK